MEKILLYYVSCGNLDDVVIDSYVTQSQFEHGIIMNLNFCINLNF